MRVLSVGAAWMALVVAAAGATAAAASTEFASLLRPGSRSALGLGGDPFRSPLRDECGWWSQPEFTWVPRVRMVSRSSQPLSEGAETGGRLSAGETSWRVGGETRIAGRPLSLAGRFSNVRWAGAFDAADGELRLSNEGAGAEAALRLEDIVPGLSAQAAGPLWSEHGRGSAPSAGVGVRLHAGHRVVAQASWTGSRRPELLRSDLYGEPLIASLNLRSEQRRLDARVRLPGRLALEASVGREGYAPSAPRSDALAYQLGPEGTSGLDQLSLEWTARPGLRVLARRTQTVFDLEGEASWGGERFAQVNYARAELRSNLVAIEAGIARGARVILDVEHAEAHARARAVLETWPFTPALGDLIGLRRIGRASARARWDRVHTGIERGLGASGRLQLGAGWYDAWPEGFIESWRPTFLVFGRSDQRVDRIPFARAQLGSATVGLDWRLGGLDCGLALEQFVFAKTFGRGLDSTAPGGPPASSDAPPAAHGSGRWPGGTSLELSLSRRF
jgi:hypothetical protein